MLTSDSPSAVSSLTGRWTKWQRLTETDVLGKKKFQEEVPQTRNTVKPERVPCPQAGCECTYEMYGYEPANLADYVAKLQDRVECEHPDHTSEVLAVNEFRKVPR